MEEVAAALVDRLAHLGAAPRELRARAPAKVAERAGQGASFDDGDGLTLRV